MKKTIMACILAISLIGSTGCIGWRDHSQGVKPYVKPAVSLTVLTVLDNAVDEEDRVKRALLMYHAGTILQSLAAGDVPSAGAVKAALEEYLPEGVMWADFISSLDDIYKTAYNRANDDTQLVLEIVVEMAAGLREGSGKYLSDHGTELPGGD
jgi:hypothetical protein